MTYYVTTSVLSKGIEVFPASDVEELLTGELRILSTRKIIKAGGWTKSRQQALVKAEQMRTKRVYKLGKVIAALEWRNMETELTIAEELLVKVKGNP